MNCLGIKPRGFPFRYCFCELQCTIYQGRIFTRVLETGSPTRKEQAKEGKWGQFTDRMGVYWLQI